MLWPYRTSFGDTYFSSSYPKGNSESFLRANPSDLSKINLNLTSNFQYLTRIFACVMAALAWRALKIGNPVRDVVSPAPKR